MKLSLRLLTVLLFIFVINQNTFSQKKTKIFSAGTMISRISEKPFNFKNGLRPGIRPMFEYQVEKNIFGSYFYTYGVGYKGLGEQHKYTIKNFKDYVIKYTPVFESSSGGFSKDKLDTLFTYVGDLTYKNRIHLGYVYFPVGITYYATEKLSFGVEYSLAYVWGGKYSATTMFSDVPNNYYQNYSSSIDLPGSKQTNEKYVYRWDHWLRIWARYQYKDYLFRFGFERGLRNMFTAKTIPGTVNGKAETFYTSGFSWKNTSIYLNVGIKLPENM